MCSWFQLDFYCQGHPLHVVQFASDLSEIRVVWKSGFDNLKNYINKYGTELSVLNEYIRDVRIQLVWYVDMSPIEHITNFHYMRPWIVTWSRVRDNGILEIHFSSSSARARRPDLQTILRLDALIDLALTSFLKSLPLIVTKWIICIIIIISPSLPLLNHPSVCPLSLIQFFFTPLSCWPMCSPVSWTVHSTKTLCCSVLSTKALHHLSLCQAVRSHSKVNKGHRVHNWQKNKSPSSSMLK